MKNNKINVYFMWVLCITQASIQAENIFSKNLNKAKKTAQSAYKQTKKGWNSLDKETKQSIKKGLAAAGTAALAAGTTAAAYYGYDQYNSSMKPSFTFLNDQATLNELVSFLSTDPNYKGNPSNQRMFFNRFKDQGITNEEIEYILSLVASRNPRPALEFIPSN